jgi:hypothetical protein
VDDAGLLRLAPERPRFDGGGRERLVGHDVLARGERGPNHRTMEVIRRRVVNDVHVGIGRERLVVVVRRRHAQRVGLALS